MHVLRRLFILSLAIVFVFGLFPQSAVAHEKREHNSELETVLFGQSKLQAITSNEKEYAEEAVSLIEDAAYLTLDQFNGLGTNELDHLKKAHIFGIPRNISEIDFQGNSYHRRYTHMGWNAVVLKKGDTGNSADSKTKRNRIAYALDKDFDYKRDKANWNVRKEILLATVNKVMKFGLTSNTLTGYDKKCDSFASLIYYIHVIGDHLEDSSYMNRSPKMELAYVDKSDVGIIDELLDDFEVLFEDQKNSFSYKELIHQLKNLQETVRDIINRPGGLGSETNYTEYHECAEQLMEILGDKLPELLEKEEFFSKIFY